MEGEALRRPARPQGNVAVGPDLVTMSQEDLDDAIAQVSNALRVLLELGLQRKQPIINLRSNAMATEAATSNSSERYDVFVVENFENSAVQRSPAGRGWGSRFPIRTVTESMWNFWPFPSMANWSFADTA